MLKERIEIYYELGSELEVNKECKDIYSEFINLLDTGKIRAAEPFNGEWIVNTWVKKGILLGFKIGLMEDLSYNKYSFYEKSSLPLKDMSLQHNIRIVPGGSSFRKGCYLAPGVIVMPPCFGNIGGYVDSGTMLDSHSLVGSCAQIGKNCHISAGAQIGGVLEPMNANPVIIEDNVLIGGNCGLYEGVIVRKNSIIASGVIITGSTQIYDLVNERIIKKDNNGKIEIPSNVVVVPGSRPANYKFAKEYGVHVYAPVIVKYRDDKTDAKATLEEILRSA